MKYFDEVTVCCVQRYYAHIGRLSALRDLQFGITLLYVCVCTGTVSLFYRPINTDNSQKFYQTGQNMLDYIYISN
jgi:hypothetical protein